MTTWQILFDYERENVSDTSRFLAVTPVDLDWEREFDSGYGGNEGVPFLAWTENRVYFCVCYDGSEWVASVPRNPCEETADHIGGG